MGVVGTGRGSAARRSSALPAPDAPLMAPTTSGRARRAPRRRGGRARGRSRSGSTRDRHRRAPRARRGGARRGRRPRCPGARARGARSRTTCAQSASSLEPQVRAEVDARPCRARRSSATSGAERPWGRATKTTSQPASARAWWARAQRRRRPRRATGRARRPACADVALRGRDGDVEVRVRGEVAQQLAADVARRPRHPHAHPPFYAYLCIELQAPHREHRGGQDGRCRGGAMVLFLALSVIWGLPYFLIRVAVQHGVDPATLVFLRTAPAAVDPPAPRRGARRAAAVLAGVALARRSTPSSHFGVPWLLMSNAEQHLTSSVTGMLVATVPLVAAVVARRTHPEERSAPARVAGLAPRRPRRGPPRRLRRGGLQLGVDRRDGRRRRRLRVRPGHHLAAPRGPPGDRRRRLRRDGRRPRLHPLRRHAPAGRTSPGRSSGRSRSSPSSARRCAFLVMFELISEIGPSRMVVVTYLNTAVAVVLGVERRSASRSPTGSLLGFPLIIVGSVLATRRPRRRSAKCRRQPSPTPRRSWRRASRSALPR